LHLRDLRVVELPVKTAPAKEILLSTLLYKLALRPEPKGKSAAKGATPAA